MFDNRLKLLRKSANLTQEAVAIQLGIPIRTYSSYENNEREPNSEILIKIADFYNVSTDFLLGINTISEDVFKYDNISPIETKKFPLLGVIACGEPIFANEDRESYVEAGVDIRADFCLRANGDSMINARIMDGDIVFIRKQAMVDNGEIAAVIIDDVATLKRVYYDREQQQLTLVAENPKYSPFVYRGEELDHIHILGKAVAFQSDVI